MNKNVNLLTMIIAGICWAILSLISGLFAIISSGVDEGVKKFKK